MTVTTDSKIKINFICEPVAVYFLREAIDCIKPKPALHNFVFQGTVEWNYYSV